jgi:DNA-binding NarL/FixJ family response regulator
MVLRVRIAEPLNADCPLSLRQLEVLSLVGCGLTTRAISRELSLAEATIDNHIAMSSRLLGTNNRLSAVIAGLYHGWLVIQAVDTAA